MVRELNYSLWMKTLSIGASLSLAAPHLYAAEEAVGSPPPFVGGATTPIEDGWTTEVGGAVNVGRRNLQLWYSLRNEAAKPERWQVRYDPVFLPQTNAAGQIVFTPIEKVGGFYRTSFAVLLDLPELRKLALEVVERCHPEVANRVSSNNIFARPIRGLSIRPRAGFGEAYPDVEVVDGVYSFGRPQQSVTVTFASPNRAALEAVIAAPERLNLDFCYNTYSVVAQRTRVVLTSKQIRQTELFARLDGLGDEVLIRRFDMRRLLEESRHVLEADVLIEDPQRLVDGLLQQLIARVTEREQLDSAGYAEQKTAATYHGDDLKPDHLTKNFNKIFTLDQSKQHWVRSGSLDSAAGLSLLKVLSANGTLKASFSTDELLEYLKQRDITAQVEGEQIVVKSVDVQRLNLAALQGEHDYHVNEVHVRDPHVKFSAESINLALVAQESVEVLAQCTADIEQREAARYREKAATLRDAFIAAKWLSAEGQADGHAAEASWAEGEALQAVAVDALERREFSTAAERLTAARSKYQSAAVGFTTGQLKVLPEEIVQVTITQHTSDHEDMECGLFGVEVWQGAKMIFKPQYSGRFEEGQENTWVESLAGVPQADRLITGEPITLIARLEERDGEVDIDWVADRIAVTVRTNRGRTFSAEASHRFQTDEGNTSKTLGSGQVN